MKGQNPKITAVLSALSKERYGITCDEAQEKDICINCKEPALAKCYSSAGINEYSISGICEECFDEMLRRD